MKTDVFRLDMMHKELRRATDGVVARDRGAEAEIAFSEVIFAVPTDHPQVSILVYTSYSPKSKKLHGDGEDAVKFVVRYEGQERTRFVGNLKKVHRTLNGNGGLQAFYDRIVDEVATIMALALPIQVCDCGSILVPRWAKKKQKWFRGCFDLCGRSQDVDIQEER